MQVGRQHGQQCLVASGARVRNTYATYPVPGHNPPKGGLISHDIADGHPSAIKDSLVQDGHASH
jgi:hypothetical protein